jgi:polyhydroxyalkanoate synthesis repressor PhaR
MPHRGKTTDGRCHVVRMIKRYGSRKLYDTEESRYVSLEELGGWIRGGQEIRVIDNETSDDVTAQTLTQVILEEGRRGTALPPSDTLHALIRQGGEIVSSGVTQLNQGVDRLIQAGVERIGPVREIRKETEVLRKRLDDLESALSRLETGNGNSPEEDMRTSEEEGVIEDDTGTS